MFVTKNSLAGGVTYDKLTPLQHYQLKVGDKKNKSQKPPAFARLSVFCKVLVPNSQLLFAFFVNKVSRRGRNKRNKAAEGKGYYYK